MNHNELRNSIKNPQVLYEGFSWHFPPVTYYVIDEATKEVLFAFLDTTVLSYESLMFISENFDEKINYRIITKEKYEELFGVQDE